MDNLVNVKDYISTLSLDKVKRLFTDSKYPTKKTLIGTLLALWVGKSFYNWLKMKYYFKKLNLPGPTPLPIVGNFLEMMQKGFDGFDVEMMTKYNRMCGTWEGSTPTILTSDPLFLREIMIKESASFMNHRRIDGIDYYPFDKFVSDLRDEEWKNVRSIITTAFTSGKIKEMSKLFKKSTDNVEKYLKKIADQDEILDTKEIFGSYSLEIISSCLFGIESNAVSNKGDEFLGHLETIFANSESLAWAFLFLFPTLSKFLQTWHLFEAIPSKSIKYLSNVSEEIMTRRRNKLERRSDFMQIMIDHEESIKKADDEKEKVENEKSKPTTWNKPLKKTLTDSEILAQAFLFLIAGYETTASTINLTTYYLAKNPDVQEKLYSEICQVLRNHNGEVNYESVSDMKYMDMVIAETLRLCPAAVRTDRLCGSEFKWKNMQIPQNAIVNVSIWALHHDPEFFPDPEKFRPERFSEEEKKTRPNEAYMPFGAGPRICIGMRFANIEMKFLLTEILTKFRFVTCEKTPKKIKIDFSGLGRPKDKIYLKVKERQAV